MTNSSTPSPQLIADSSLQFIDALDLLTNQIAFIKDTFIDYNLFQPHQENETFMSLQNIISDYIEAISLEVSALKELYDALVLYSTTQ